MKVGLIQIKTNRFKLEISREEQTVPKNLKGSQGN